MSKGPVTGLKLFSSTPPLSSSPLPSGSQLTRGRWAFAYALVTSLFFTCTFLRVILINVIMQLKFHIIFLKGVLLTESVSSYNSIYHELIELFVFQLLDVLNAHFQVIFRIDKTRSTLLQLAYFGAYLVWSPFAGIFVGYFVCPERCFSIDLCLLDEKAWIQGMHLVALTIIIFIFPSSA